MRKLHIFLTILWASFWIFIGIGLFLETPNQIEKDNEFIKNKLKPCVEFVQNFEKENKRLPNYREFYVWDRNFFKDYTGGGDSLISMYGKYIRSENNIISNDLGKFEKANWKTDYAIGIWRGEWMEYYFSWTDSYDTNNYSWNGAFIGLLIYLGLAIVPIISLWFYYRKRKMKLVSS